MTYRKKMSRFQKLNYIAGTLVGNAVKSLEDHA